MSGIGKWVVAAAGAVVLGMMMNTVPNYNSSFQPAKVFADEGGVGDSSLFHAQLIGLKTAGTIAYQSFGQEISRDTSATFLVAELTVTGRSSSRQLQAIWLGSTGRQYNQSGRLQNAPRDLSARAVEPGLTDRAIAIFELPEDEIVGGKLGLMPRGVTAGGIIMHFSGPDTLPQKQAMLRLEP